jgi:hypothetical protein
MDDKAILLMIFRTLIDSLKAISIPCVEELNEFVIDLQEVKVLLLFLIVGLLLFEDSILLVDQFPIG